jgi:hypothetical protein
MADDLLFLARGLRARAAGISLKIGAEYLHVELDGPSADVGGVSISTKATTDLGRATLNYKF